MCKYIFSRLYIYIPLLHSILHTSILINIYFHNNYITIAIPFSCSGNLWSPVILFMCFLSFNILVSCFMTSLVYVGVRCCFMFTYVHLPYFTCYLVWIHTLEFHSPCFFFSTNTDCVVNKIFTLIYIYMNWIPSDSYRWSYWAVCFIFCFTHICKEE